MSGLRVGMQVRIIRARGIVAHLLGETDTISAFTSDGYAYLTKHEFVDCIRAHWHPATLEPVTPPKSQQLVSWDEMPCTRSGQYREVVVVGEVR